MFEFFAVPAWELKPGFDARKSTDLMKPTISSCALSEAVLAQVEYRGYRAKERAVELLGQANPAVFAKSPQDLPALLRMADQLVTMAKVDSGERARLFRCSCGTPYAVPVGPVRPLTLRCERCGNTVELDPTVPQGEVSERDAQAIEVNQARHSLAEFFREAMARGWPVLVQTAR
jgi:hypothetical protein